MLFVVVCLLLLLLRRKSLAISRYFYFKSITIHSREKQYVDSSRIESRICSQLKEKVSHISLVSTLGFDNFENNSTDAECIFKFHLMFRGFFFQSLTNFSRSSTSWKIKLNFIFSKRIKNPCVDMK